MQKECTVCGKVYEKKVSYSYKQWSKSKYCSNECGWEDKKSQEPNSGCFKKGHTRGHRFPKGHTPWNNGLSVRLNPAGEFKKGDNLGELNNNWKGDNVCYRVIHSWVVRHKGSPQECEHCGREDKKKYEWANIDHKYRRDLKDYIRLCTSCHRIYDNARKTK